MEWVVYIVLSFVVLISIASYERTKRIEEKIDGLIEDINDLSVDFHNHYYSVTTNNPDIKMIGTVSGTWSNLFTPAFSRSTQYGEQDDSN